MEPCSVEGLSMDQHELRIFEAHERLKTALRKRGTSLNRIAKELGVTSAAVSFVGLRKNRSDRIEQALADALDTTPEALFPAIPKKRGKP